MSQSQSTSFDADDPRLTAYVLDELEPAERAELEQLLASSPEARAAVGEIRETIGVLNSAYDSEPLRELEPLADGSAFVGSDGISAMNRDGSVSRPKLSRRTILSLTGMIIAASLFVAVFAYDRIDDPKSKRFGEVIALYDKSSDANGPTAATNAEALKTEYGRLVAANDSLRKERELLREQITGQNDGSDSLMLTVTPRIIIEDAEQQLHESTPHAAPVAPVPIGIPAQPTTIASDGSQQLPTGVPAPGGGSVIRLWDSKGNQFSPGTITDSGTDPALVPQQPISAGTVVARPRLANSASPDPKDVYNIVGGAAGAQSRADVAPNATVLGVPGMEYRTWEMKPPEVAGKKVEGRKAEVFWAEPNAGQMPALESLVELNEQERRLYLRYHPSTAQPNAEAYEPIIENDFLAPTAAPLSTFGVDVDTASYSNVRRFLTQNQLPPANAVRIEELLNYFKYSDPAPQGDKPFSCGLEAAACPWNPDNILVRIGLKGKEIPRTERPASNLVFLIDVSGSMKDDNKLPLVKSGLELLVGELTANDRVAIVTYAGHAGVALEPTAGNEKPKILQVIQGLSAEGSTNGEGGLKLAYEQATRSFITNGTNRVILCTDGDFNVGVSDDNELVQIIGRQAKSGVYLSIFGFGMGNIKDAKLEKLADRGNGHYGYIDGIREAQKVFVEEMTGTLYTIAKDVKVQIEFNPGRVGAYRLIGYENRVMAAQDFRNDAKDSGDIGAGHSVTALYEIIPVHKMPGKQPLKYQPTADAGAPVLPNQSPELLTLSLRYKRPESPQPPAPGVTTPAESQKSVQEDYPLAAPTDATAKTSEDFRWSAAVAAFGMILRNSAHKGNADLRMVADLASSSISRWGGPNDLNFQTAEHVRRNEFITLVEAARRLRNELPKPHQDDAPKQ